MLPVKIVLFGLIQMVLVLQTGQLINQIMMETKTAQLFSNNLKEIMCGTMYRVQHHKSSFAKTRQIMVKQMITINLFTEQIHVQKL